MEQVQIQCPKCKSVLLVKNSDGSRERVVNCPTCQTPIMVTFSGMAGAPQPGGQTALNPQGQQPMQQSYYGQSQPMPSPVQDNSPKKNNAWLIALLTALVLALAGVLIWLLVFKDKDKASTTSSTSSATQTEQISSSALASASITPETSASVSVIPEDIDEIPEISAEERPSRSISGYALPYVSDTETDVANQLIKRLNPDSFLNIYDGVTGADLKSLRSRDLSKKDQKQLTVEDGNGYRYQFFFMNSNKYDGKLTGVAVSHQCYDARQECASFDDYLRRSNNFDAVGRNMYQSSGGNYISPGYAKGRLYVYYYLPDAPEKGAAPRK